VEKVILSGHHTWDGFEETLMRSNDELRECFTCGPDILSSFTREIVTRKYSRMVYSAKHALA
jgi:hypothetical protein